MYNRNMSKFRLLSIAVTVLMSITVLSGCGMSTIKYVNPDADISYIQDIAILPFNNMASDRYAGSKIRSLFSVYLRKKQAFNVVEEGEVSRVVTFALRAAGVEEGGLAELDKETIKLIGEKLSVQAIIIGSVESYGQSAGASDNSVTLSFKMMDTSSGMILWQVNTTASSGNMLRKIFGLSSVDSTTLGIRAVKKAVNTLI